GIRVDLVTGVQTCALPIFTIQQNGKWTYTLDNTNPALDDLDTGHTLTDTFTVHTADGTAQQVSIAINGATDDRGGPTGISFAIKIGRASCRERGECVADAW